MENINSAQGSSSFKIINQIQVVEDLSPEVPVLNYLTPEIFSAAVDDLNRFELWDSESMQLVPFLAVFHPSMGINSIDIEDQNGQNLLSVSTSSQRQGKEISIQMYRNDNGLAIFRPRVGDQFENIPIEQYGDSLVIAIICSQDQCLPSKISPRNIIYFRQDLSSAMSEPGCEDFINNQFQPWLIPSELRNVLPRGRNDSTEDVLVNEGYTFIARGQDVYSQFPQLRKSIILIDNVLTNLFNNSATSHQTINYVIAAQLGIDIQSVSQQMLDLTLERMTDYHATVRRYLNEDASQFLLSRPINDQPEVYAQAFPGDVNSRIMFMTGILKKPHVKILQTVAHEISHMIPNGWGTHDYYYVLGLGVPDDIRTSSGLLSAMIYEANQATSAPGLEEILLSNIIDSMRLNLQAPCADMSDNELTALLEGIKYNVLEEENWHRFISNSSAEGVPLEWLNEIKDKIENKGVWRYLRWAVKNENLSPAQLVEALRNDKLAMLRVILFNADTFVLNLLATSESEVNHFFKLHGLKMLNPAKSETSIDAGSQVSSTPEINYRSLANPDQLSSYQGYQALEDLAYALSRSSKTGTDTPDSADIATLRQFLADFGGPITNAFGINGNHLPINFTLYLGTLKHLLTINPNYYLKILSLIVPAKESNEPGILYEMGDRFWVDGKLIAWQQLLHSCLVLCSPEEKMHFLPLFTSTPAAERFFNSLSQQINDPTRVICPLTSYALKAMVNDGLIPSSYPIVHIINSLDNPVHEPRQTGLDDILTYAQNNQLQFAEQYINSLGRAEFLCGLARQMQEYIVSENDEHDTELYFDPYGNSVLSNQPELSDNQIVILLRNNQLAVWRQMETRFEVTATHELATTENMEILEAAARLINGVVPDSNYRSNLINGFINIAHSGFVECENESPAHSIHLTSESKSKAVSEKTFNNTGKIRNQLDKLSIGLTQDKTTLFNTLKSSPMNKIKSTLVRLNDQSIGVLDFASNPDIASIVRNVRSIESNISRINSDAPINDQLSLLSSLPNNFHLIREHAENLQLSMQAQRTIKRKRGDDNDHTRQAKKLKKAAERGLRTTLRARGKIHSLTSSSIDRHTVASQIKVISQQFMPVPEPAVPTATGFGGFLAAGLAMAAEAVAFNEERNFEYAQRDEIRAREHQQQLAEKYADREQAMVENSEMSHYFNISLENDRQRSKAKKARQETVIYPSLENVSAEVGNEAVTLTPADYLDPEMAELVDNVVVVQDDNDVKEASEIDETRYEYDQLESEYVNPISIRREYAINDNVNGSVTMTLPAETLRASNLSREANYRSIQTPVESHTHRESHANPRIMTLSDLSPQGKAAEERRRREQFDANSRRRTAADFPFFKSTYNDRNVTQNPRFMTVSDLIARERDKANKEREERVIKRFETLQITPHSYKKDSADRPRTTPAQVSSHPLPSTSRLAFSAENRLGSVIRPADKWQSSSSSKTDASRLAHQTMVAISQRRAIHSAADQSSEFRQQINEQLENSSRSPLLEQTRHQTENNQTQRMQRGAFMAEQRQKELASKVGKHNTHK